jgi:acyl carrier protein
MLEKRWRRMSSEIKFFGFPSHVAVKSSEAAPDCAGTRRDARSSHAESFRAPEQAGHGDSAVTGDRVREIIRAHFGLTEVPADSITFGHFATDWIDRLEINMDVEQAFNIVIDCALIDQLMSARRTVGSFVKFVEGCGAVVPD